MPCLQRLAAERARAAAAVATAASACGRAAGAAVVGVRAVVRTPKHCGNGVGVFVKCGGCAWCGEARLASCCRRCTCRRRRRYRRRHATGVVDGDGRDRRLGRAGRRRSLSLSSSLAASASRIGAVEPDEPVVANTSRPSTPPRGGRAHKGSARRAARRRHRPRRRRRAAVLGVLLRVPRVPRRGHARPSTYGHTAPPSTSSTTTTPRPTSRWRGGRVHHGGRRTNDKYRRLRE